MKSVISSKGRVTIPVKIREKLGLFPGSVVRFELLDGKAVLHKGDRGIHPVDAVYGILSLKRPVGEILDEMRGPRPKRK